MNADTSAPVTGSAPTQVQCTNCGAALALAQFARTTTCPYCGLASVVEHPPSPDRPRPTFALPFVLPREAALERVHGWVRALGFFKPTAVRNAKVESLQGVYVPAYLYTAMARSGWEARIGENYTETETYTVTNDKGQSETRTRTVTRTEHRPLAGERIAFVHDVLVTASRGIPNDSLQAIEPFDLRLLRRYDPAIVVGWNAEDPSMTARACIDLARREALSLVGREIDGFMPGDSHDGVTHRTELDRESLDLVLVPVWVMALRYASNKPVLNVLVNGQTGMVGGKAPTDWLRVALVVLAVVAVGAVLVAVFAHLGAQPSGVGP